MNAAAVPVVTRPIARTLAVTITSLDLVDVINSMRDPARPSLRHDTFLVKVEKVLGPTHQNFLASYNDATGRALKCYALPKREAALMVMSESYEVQAKVYDRMAELEAATAPAVKIPTSFAEALRLAAEQAEMLEQQSAQLAAAQPAVEFVDRYVDSTGSKGFRQVCKLLGARESTFRRFLIDRKIMYLLGGEWTPHAHHLDAGRFEIKVGTVEATAHAFNQARFTPKGVTWVAGEWAKYQLVERAA